MDPRRSSGAALMSLSLLVAGGCDDRHPADAPPPPVILVQDQAGVEVAAAPGTACDAVDADPFVVEFRDRVVRHGELARFAETRFGPPTGCEGEVTSEFDGLRYGTLRLEYAAGAAALTVRTMPPETSVTTLTVADGFRDRAEARDLLENHVSRVGLAIDWSRPQSMTVDGRTTTEYTGPDGFNAFARLVGADRGVDTIEFSLAL